MIEDIPIIYEFDEETDSISSYLFTCDEVIEKRLKILRKIESKDLKNSSDSVYELLNACTYAAELLFKRGRISEAIKYAIDGLDYCQKYKQFFSGMDMYYYTARLDRILMADK